MKEIDGDMEKKSIEINISELYNFDQKDLEINVSSVGYSNLSFIQVTHRDVCIDFLEMPGVNKDGKRSVNGKRIYMSHAAAQSLASELESILRKVYKNKVMEFYSPRKENKSQKSNE